MINQHSLHSKTLLFAVLFLISCSHQSYPSKSSSQTDDVARHQMQKIQAENISVSDRAPDTDTLVENMIAPYKQELDDEMNEIIASLDEALNKSKSDNTLGNWIADELYDYLEEHNYDVDLSLINYGGIRLNNLPKGDLTIGKIYELLPFENYVVILELDVNQIKDLFTHVTNNGGWPISKDWEISYDEEGLSSIRYKGQELGHDAVIKVAVPDYVANGGSDTSVLIGIPQENTKILIRDAIIDALKSREDKSIKIQSENRIIKNE